jgi:hypothetical protein
LLQPKIYSNTSRCAPLVKGVLYFWAYDNNYRIDHIAAYDLDTEKWRQDLLHLPLPIHEAIPLAELSDTLVAVYRRNSNHTYRNCSDLCIDLWFLTDSEKVLWSKRYTIVMPYHGCWRPCECDTSYGYAHPLLALDDGKIVFWVTLDWRRGDGRHVRINSLRVYDTRTNTCMSSVEMPDCELAGVYRGSLLARVPWIRN